MTGDTNELADRINAAFQEVLSAEGNKLFCAIGLGEALKEAKEKIRQARKEAPAHLKPHVAKWPEWLTRIIHDSTSFSSPRRARAPSTSPDLIRIGV